MYNSDILNRRDYPVLNATLKRAVPGYKKHKIIAITCEGLEPHGTTWDGGSKSYYAAYNVDGSNPRNVPAPSSPPQFGGGEVKTFDLEPGTIVISGGTFQGRTATIKLYALPEDMAKIIK